MMHNGIDIAAKKGSIYAVESGKIRYAGWGRGYGNYIQIAIIRILLQSMPILCLLIKE